MGEPADRLRARVRLPFQPQSSRDALWRDVTAYVLLHAAAQVRIECDFQAGALLVPLPVLGHFVSRVGRVCLPAAAASDFLADRGESAAEARGDVSV